MVLERLSDIYNRLIKIWSTLDGRLVDTLRGHKQDINAIAVSLCGSYLASCANDMAVFVWSLEKKRPIAVFRDHTKAICSLSFHKESYQNELGETRERCILATVGEDSTLRIYQEEDFGMKFKALMEAENSLISQ